MATTTASPPRTANMPKSPPAAPTLAAPNSQQQRPNPHRQPSLLSRRISSYASSRSAQSCSRPISTVFPAFHSSLSYTLVRDFAYPWNHPTHYGPSADDEASTPVSESRRLSDPEMSGWEDSRAQWSATPPWIVDNNYSSRDQLPAMTFNDGGPPYSEDDDLQSPVVTSSRNKKHKSERGRSPAAVGLDGRGMSSTSRPDRVEEYRPTDSEDLDGPGGEIETYTRAPYNAKHRDSNFAKPLQRAMSPSSDSFARRSEDNSDDETRLSRDYSFTIASPDEEMHGKAVALFDFESEHENELPLREGQIVLVSYRLSQGWLVAEDPRTGENGLVPEEFVRLLRDIEGGLNGLRDIDEGTEPVTSPVSNEVGSNATPTQANEGFDYVKQPAVQSNFSTHTRDFSPMPKPGQSGEGARVPQDRSSR